MMMMHRIEKSNLRTLRAKEGKKNERRQKLHRDEKNFKNTSDSSFQFQREFSLTQSALFSRELNGHFTKTSSSLQSKFTRVFILRNKPRKTALIKEDKEDKKNFR